MTTTSWAHGYVADSPYTFSYQAAQSPGNLALICAMMGVAWEPRARMVVADIGCGRGYTVNTLAAANPGWTVLGLDYNPAHIAEAIAVSEGAGLENTVFVEADLAEMTDAEMDRLPEMDVVSLHGVWTWVSDAVRQGIVRLLARRLKPGGLCYMGYNAMPAFGADMALQRLIRHLAAQQVSGNSPMRVQAAIETVKQLHATRPANLPATPMLKRIAEDDTPLDASYLAHEFLTAHWRPVFFEDLCADLAPAKLDYVGSASLHENVPDLLFPPEQRAIYEALPAGPAREFMKDLCIGRIFRRDVFVRGLRRTDPLAALDRIVLGAMRVLGEETPKLQVPVGQAEIGADLWEPIAAALNEGPQSLGRLRSLPVGRSPNPAELVTVLSGTGLVLPALRDSGPTEPTRRFNRYIAETYAQEGRAGGQFAMASPVLASGLPCLWLELAIAVQPEIGGNELPSPELLARRVLPDLEGEAMATAIRMVTTVLSDRLDIWRRFGII
ncbi:class I SAM-dependent methyltransferase [Sediminicoccus sp. KRV36]|uniref:class I SAM-dependent methyltransferase n=1 Tax=Sediminicoccus sp. KRV36 TaxID=3133721 RepID=UPI00200E4C78|nr:class I SAM-dependent methyltransferase [Sediminicoccus rosea]UPY37722.1 class I SAM-dependent methyltransferase [Sediminicoccus rosea]